MEFIWYDFRFPHYHQLCYCKTFYYFLLLHNNVIILASETFFFFHYPSIFFLIDTHQVYFHCMILKSALHVSSFCYDIISFIAPFFFSVALSFVEKQTMDFTHSLWDHDKSDEEKYRYSGDAAGYISCPTKDAKRVRFKFFLVNVAAS